MTEVKEHTVVALQSGNSVVQIADWFKKAVPHPTTQNIHTQIGVNFEETGEMIAALQPAGAVFQNREELSFVGQVVDFASRQMKNSGGDFIELEDVNRVELLDAICDQIVTAIGIAVFLGMDIEGALKEVADSNDSKFDSEGNPIFNEARKIMKGPNYFKPELAKYV